jgi:putative NADH-flavin reductase
LIAAEQKKVLEQQVTILNDRITNYQSIVSSLNAKDSVTVATFNMQIKLLTDEKALYQDQIKGYEKLLKKERRKRFLTTAGGVLTTGIVAYLYLTK